MNIFQTFAFESGLQYATPIVMMKNPKIGFKMPEKAVAKELITVFISSLWFKPNQSGEYIPRLFFLLNLLKKVWKAIY